MERTTYVRLKLSEFRLTQTWLRERLKSDYDVVADASEISKALSGELKTPKAVSIVAHSVDIVNAYESRTN